MRIIQAAQLIEPVRRLCLRACCNLPADAVAALAAARERMREDRMATLAVQLQWLQQAGFVDISTWYRYYNFAIFSGSKALTPSTPARRESAGLRTGPALLA